MIQGLYTIFDSWHANNAVWIIGDTHFGDEELKKAYPSRPTDADLVKKINSKAGKCDTLVLLGDVGDIACVAQLRAKKKILIMGNHDLGRTNYEPYFDEIYEGALFIGAKLVLSHEPINIPFAFNIHGHAHEGNKGDSHHLNVCADACGYEPLNLNQFMKSGALASIEDIHRTTINKATKKKMGRGKRTH